MLTVRTGRRWRLRRKKTKLEWAWLDPYTKNAGAWGGDELTHSPNPHSLCGRKKLQMYGLRRRWWKRMDDKLFFRIILIQSSAIPPSIDLRLGFAFSVRRRGGRVQ
ncbi:hypothetical protein GPALN_001844 [Globodera pallida]|nr:hypothetical protein GPALN_001844 [Globodera pallida]